MTAIPRTAAALAALLLAADAWAQTTGSLQLSIVLRNAQGRVAATTITHVLLVTKQGALDSPMRLLTRSDGTAEVALEPGTYVIRSNRGYPFAGNYHSWDVTFSIAQGETTLVELTVQNAIREPILAPVPRPAPEPERLGPVTVFQVKYGAPGRFAAGASMLFPIGELKSEDGLTGARGVEAGATAGAGGWRVEGGAFAAAFPFRMNALVTVTKTSAAPRGATPSATYVGLEGGIAAIPIGGDAARIVLLRPSIGVMHRVSGPAGPKRTTFTWSIDVQVLGGW